MQQKDYDTINAAYLREALAGLGFVERSLERVRGITGMTPMEQAASQSMEDIERIKVRLTSALKDEQANG